MKKLLFVLLPILFVSCNVQKRDATSPLSSSKHLLELQEKNQLLVQIINISKETNSSDSIATTVSGKEFIAQGERILKLLPSYFTDSTITNVYSVRNKRNLKLGEIAIILAGEIKRIPIFQVAGIQQCTPPFNFEIESFLYSVERNPNRFIQAYNDWLIEEKLVSKRTK